MDKAQLKPFDAIRPFEPDELPAVYERLIGNDQFRAVAGHVFPGVPFDMLAAKMRSCATNIDFQKAFCYAFLKNLLAKASLGCDFDSSEIDLSHRHTFVSNHRDIVLDASFLGLVMIRNGYPAQEVALGDNLLIYDWIEHLVRLNKGVIVKRNLRLTKALEAAKQLSGYIHYCINQKHESVWIAQREGRAKDSNDLTQESVLKMLALDGKSENIAARLLELNITPVAISYEYDPTDYLKASEFLARRRDPDFKKSPNDDLKSMETGLLSYKGHVHYTICPEINEALTPLTESTDKVEIIHTVCRLIDRSIHLGYYIYPINYYAYDRVEGNSRFADKYTAEDAHKFEEYFNKQLNLVRLPDVTAEEREFMLHEMLMMYANPLRNRLVAEEAK